MKKRSRPEAHIQVAVAKWLEQEQAERKRRGLYIFHYHANEAGGRKNMIEAVNQKRRGVRKGIPDIEIVYQGRAYFMELKADNGRLSVGQLEIKEEIEAAGGYWVSTFGIVEAIKTLEMWLAEPKQEKSLPCDTDGTMLASSS